MENKNIDFDEVLEKIQEEKEKTPMEKVPVPVRRIIRTDQKAKEQKLFD